jgi:hypothetical protein
MEVSEGGKLGKKVAINNYFTTMREVCQVEKHGGHEY